MSMDGADGGGQSSQTPSGPASHLPWHLIPTFEPGESDLTEYTRRLEFLAGLWPAEYLGQHQGQPSNAKGPPFRK